MGNWENWDRVSFLPGKKKLGPNFPSFNKKEEKNE